MLKNLFRKQEYITVSSKPLKDKEFIPNIPNGKWINCKKCKSTVEVLVKEDIVSVRPMIIRDDKLKERIRVYSQKIMNP